MRCQRTFFQQVDAHNMVKCMLLVIKMRHSSARRNKDTRMWFWSSSADPTTAAAPGSSLGSSREIVILEKAVRVFRWVEQNAWLTGYRRSQSQVDICLADWLPYVKAKDSSNLMLSGGRGQRKTNQHESRAEIGAQATHWGNRYFVCAYTPLVKSVNTHFWFNDLFLSLPWLVAFSIIPQGIKTNM